MKVISKALEGSLGAGTHQVDPGLLLRVMANNIAPYLDPKTQAWIQGSLEKTFGFPSVARFSWTTVKVALEKSAHPVKWYVSFSDRVCLGVDWKQDR